MKKLLIIVALAITSLSNAQTVSNNVSKTSLHDEVEVPVEIKSYRAKINLSLQNARYDNTSLSFEDMKEELFQKIFATGIQQTQVVEREEEFYISGCGCSGTSGSEGTTYEFITSDKDKIADFLASTSVSGVTPKDVEFQLTYDESQFSNDLSNKISKLRKRAEIMAEGLGLKIIKVNRVDLSQNQHTVNWQSYKDNASVHLYIEYILG